MSSYSLLSCHKHLQWPLHFLHIQRIVLEENSVHSGPLLQMHHDQHQEVCRDPMIVVLEILECARCRSCRRRRRGSRSTGAVSGARHFFPPTTKKARRPQPPPPTAGNRGAFAEPVAQPLMAPMEEQQGNAGATARGTSLDAPGTAEERPSG